MSNVLIDLDEYRGLIRTRERYLMFMDAIMDASEVQIREWRNNEPYMTLNEEAILTAFKVIDRDGYEALFLKKLSEAECKTVNENEDEEE